MRVVRIKEDQKDFFASLDPFEIMDTLKDKNAFCLGAVAGKDLNNTPVGLMVCVLLEETLLIRWLYTDPRCRLKDIGDLLLDAAFGLAANGGRSCVCVYPPQGFGAERVCNGYEQYFRMNGFSYKDDIPGIALKLLCAHVDEAERDAALPYGILDDIMRDEENIDIHEALQNAHVNGDDAAREKNDDDLMITAGDIAASAIVKNIKSANHAVSINDISLPCLERGLKKCLIRHPYDIFDEDILSVDPGNFDPELSCCIMDKGQISGIFLVNKEADDSFWPIYLYDMSINPVPNLLKMIQRSAIIMVKKYPPDTKVYVRMKRAEVKGLAEKWFGNIKK